MANVFFFSDLRPQAPFSSVLLAVAEAAAPLMARWRGEQGERESSFEVAFTAIILKPGLCLKDLLEMRFKKVLRRDMEVVNYHK